MARKYKKITYQDRLIIETMCRRKMKVNYIAEKIGVCRQTLYRELQRGGAGNGEIISYDADKAQQSLFEQIV